jgi:hypothetical protein
MTTRFRTGRGSGIRLAVAPDRTSTSRSPRQSKRDCVSAVDDVTSGIRCSCGQSPAPCRLESRSGSVVRSLAAALITRRGNQRRRHSIDSMKSSVARAAGDRRERSALDAADASLIASTLKGLACRSHDRHFAGNLSRSFNVWIARRRRRSPDLLAVAPHRRSDGHRVQRDETCSSHRTPSPRTLRVTD